MNKIAMYLFINLICIYALKGGLCYAQDVKLPEEVREQILSLPLGYYERDIGISEVRPGTKEEYVDRPGTGWRMRHHFQTTSSETYDDNLYLDEDNEVDEFITTISPQARIDFLTESLLVNVQYRLDARQYLDISEELFSHTAGLMALYRFSPRLMFSCSDVYRNAASLKGIENTDILSKDHKIDRTDNNTVTFRGEYTIVRGSNNLWLDYSRYDAGILYKGGADGAEDISSQTQALAIGLTHDFSRQTSVSPRLTFSAYENRKNNKQNYNQGGLEVGFEHNFGASLKGSGQVGLRYREYTKRDRGVVFPKMELSLENDITSRASLSVGYKFNKNVSYRSSSDYDASSLNITGRYLITRLFSANASASYNTSDYSNDNEEELLGSSLGIAYDLGKKLSMSCSYKYNKRNSATAADEYMENLYMISIETKMW